MVLNHEFEYVLDYHSYGEYILYPWGHISDKTEDDETFRKLTNQMKYFVPSYIAGKITDIMYPVNGDTADWYYGEQTEKDKILGFNFEVNSMYEGGFRPPVNLIIPTSQKHFRLLANLIGYEIEGGSENSFDADSIIYFMQQYDTDKVTIIGETPQELDDLLIYPNDGSSISGAGLDETQISRIPPEDYLSYLSYWENYEDIVYVQDNYSMALMASTYASLINAPLIIEGTDLDTGNVFVDKNIICVGSVTPLGSSCFEQYNLESLQQRYVDDTNTDKIILVNPNDLSMFATDFLYPEKSGGSIVKLYAGTSLIAPFLAGAKHEVIIPITAISSYSEADASIEENLNRLYNIDVLLESDGDGFLEEFYLTIVANGEAIPYRAEWDIAADQYYYANFDDNGGGPNISVGRIFGMTSSDFSSLVSRTLFYDELKNNDKATFMVTSTFGWIDPGDIPGVVEEWSQRFEEVRSEVVFEPKEGYRSYDYEPSLWNDNDVISYNDHGDNNWAGIYSTDIPLLDNSIIFNYACSTCATQASNSFCGRAIRQGAIVHIGAVEVAYALNTVFRDSLNNIYYKDMTVGQGFSRAYGASLREGDIDYFGENLEVDPGNFKMITFIGDPTLQLRPQLVNKIDATW